MLKKVIITGILLSTVTSALLAGGNATNRAASSARLDGLGMNVYMVEDNFNIWANPAFIEKYQSEATVNLQGQNTASVMAGGSVGTTAGTFGVYFGRPSRDLTGTMTSPVNGIAYAAPGTPPAGVNQFDLFYGIGLGEDIDMGVRLSRKGNDQSSSTSAGTVTTDTENYTSEYEIEGGVVVKSIGLDVSMALGFPNYRDVSNTPGGDVGIEDDGAFYLTVQGGYNLVLDEASKLRITGYLGTFNNNSKQVATGSSASRDESAFALNALVTYDTKVAETTTLYLSTGIAYNSYTAQLKNDVPATGKEESSQLLIPIVGAVEAEVNPEWTARVGASINNFAIYSHQKTEVVGASSTESSTTTPMNVGLNLGLGYAPIEDVDIDVAIRQGNLFSGNNLLDSLSSKVTGTYRF